MLPVAYPQGTTSGNYNEDIMNSDNDSGKEQQGTQEKLQAVKNESAGSWLTVVDHAREEVKVQVCLGELPCPEGPLACKFGDRLVPCMREGGKLACVAPPPKPCRGRYAREKQTALQVLSSVQGESAPLAEATFVYTEVPCWRKPGLEGRFSGRLLTKGDERVLAEEAKLLAPLLGGQGKKGDLSLLTPAKLMRGVASGMVRKHCEARESELRSLKARVAALEAALLKASGGNAATGIAGEGSDRGRGAAADTGLDAAAAALLSTLSAEIEQLRADNVAKDAHIARLTHQLQDKARGQGFQLDRTGDVSPLTEDGRSAEESGKEAPDVLFHKRARLISMAGAGGGAGVAAGAGCSDGAAQMQQQQQPRVQQLLPPCTAQGQAPSWPCSPCLSPPPQPLTQQLFAQQAQQLPRQPSPHPQQLLQQQWQRPLSSPSPPPELPQPLQPQLPGCFAQPPPSQVPTNHLHNRAVLGDESAAPQGYRDRSEYSWQEEVTGLGGIFDMPWSDPVPMLAGGGVGSGSTWPDQAPVLAGNSDGAVPGPMQVDGAGQGLLRMSVASCQFPQSVSYGESLAKAHSLLSAPSLGFIGGLGYGLNGAPIGSSTTCLECPPAMSPAVLPNHGSNVGGSAQNLMSGPSWGQPVYAGSGGGERVLPASGQVLDPSSTGAPPACVALAGAGTPQQPPMHETSQEDAIVQALAAQLDSMQQLQKIQAEQAQLQAQQLEQLRLALTRHFVTETTDDTACK